MRPSSLAGGAMALMVRRLTRTGGVAWPRWRLYLPLVVAALAAVVAASALAYASPPRDPVLASFSPPTVVLVVAFAAGIAVLVMEGTRDRSGSTTRALQSLPLTSRHIAALTRLPSLVLALLTLIVPLVPAVATLRGVGMAWAQALLLVLVASGAGIATMAVPYVVCSAILRSRRWDAVRFPVIFLLWGACYAGQVVAAVRGIDELAPDAPWWLPLSRVLRESLEGGPRGGTSAIVLLGAVVAGSCVVWAFLSAETDGGAPEVRREWRGRGFSGRALGELRYALRDPSVRANALIGLLLSSMAVGALLALPRGVRMQLEPTVIALVGVFAAVTPRTVRGLVPSRNPPQRLIGLSPVSWSLSTSLVVAALSGALMAPGVAVVVASENVGRAAALLVATACLSVAVAIALGSALPVAAGDVFGQAAAGSLAVAAVVALSSAFQPVLERSPGGAVLAAAALLAVAGGLAVLLEVARFTNHPHRKKERNDDG